MKRTVILIVALSMLAALVLPASVKAQTSATTQTWTSSIYYYNPDASDGEVGIDYIGFDTGKPINQTQIKIPVASHGSGEIFIGDLNLTTEFKGGAVLNSSVPVVAVYEQTPGGTDVNYGRLLYSAFDVSQGRQFAYIPSFLFQTSGFQTQVGVQNIGTSTVTLTLRFYDKDGNKVGDDVVSEPVLQNASLVFSGSSTVGGTNLSSILANFDGSVVIDAGAGGSIVAAAEEMQTNGRRAYAFEGVADVASTIFLPSAMCKYSRGAQSTTLFVQNAGNADTTITVNLYNDATRKPTGTYPMPGTIKQGARMAINLCSLKNASGKSGSATITSGNGQSLAVVGKVAGSDGLTTAYTGRTSGNTRIILPYVVWSANAAKGYRSFISVMNAGDKPANNITAAYYKPDGGDPVKTVTLAGNGVGRNPKPLPVGYKVSTNPQAAAALRPDASFRGAVEINSDQPVVVIIRLEKNIKGVKGYSYFGEDYTGIPYVP